MFRPLKPAQLVIDITVPAVCFLIAFALYAGLDGSTVLTVLGMATALAFRRLSPALSLSLAWITAVLQMLSGNEPDPSNLAILPILYATAAYGSRSVKWIGFASTFVGAASIAVYVITFPSLRDLNFSTIGLGPGSAITDFYNNPGAIGGAIMPVIGNSFLVFFGSAAAFLLSWVLGVLVRTYTGARASRRAQMRAEGQQLVAQHNVMVEQERTRIARDMHDVVAHSLAVVIAQADGARYARATDPQAVDEALTAISSTARAALGDVRVLLGQLRHSQAEGPQPVLADLTEMIDQVRASGLDVDFEELGTPGTLPTGQQLAIYRIVQEALTNALRHGASGSPATVQLRWRPDAAEILIGSTLVGAEPVPVRAGHGIAGMRERATLVGGWLTIEQTDGRFVVTSVIPRVPGSTGALPLVTGAQPLVRIVSGYVTPPRSADARATPLPPPAVQPVAPSMSLPTHVATLSPSFGVPPQPLSESDS